MVEVRLRKHVFTLVLDRMRKPAHRAHGAALEQSTAHGANATLSTIALHDLVPQLNTEP